MKNFKPKFFISHGHSDSSCNVFFTLRCSSLDWVSIDGVLQPQVSHSHIQNLSTDFDDALAKAQKIASDSNIELDTRHPKFQQNEWGQNGHQNSITNQQTLAIDLFDMFDKLQNLEWVESIPASEERQNFSGVVLGTKWEESQWGDSLKMLFKDERGFKLWGSVPSKLKDLDTLQGAKVSFNALVSRSKDDAHFGFFKRPTKAQEVL